MPTKQGQGSSQLFTLRVWIEDVEDGRHEVRGKIRHILTGEIYYFRECSSLLEILRNKLESNTKT